MQSSISLENVQNSLRMYKKPRIGLYSTGLAAYWEQFPILHDRLVNYGNFIAEKMGKWGEIHNFGMVDTAEKGKEAGA
ncbi:hypothetical protein [Peribacillus sp. ACCC06369]|uniref:hypothetical protein n=1 Tax=Peribacillus sp. ACCC06369 TaxID=3055860 RepID=UPI0025A2E9AA|nr:hypothetical protein [Peribacillus sp. ACCC06369]MDM5358206.1 hypothetical protein [Peribacillus sp. ACCC06369]